MALVLPASCAGFYMSPQLGDDNFKFVENWENAKKDLGSCRETEIYLTRKLAYESSSQPFGSGSENNSIAHDSLFNAAESNADQTASVIIGQETKSETREQVTGSETGTETISTASRQLTCPEQGLPSPSSSPEQSRESKKPHASKMIKENVSRSTHKRKLEFEELRIPDEPPRKISIRDNTPKQRRDEKKRILKMSVQKLRRMEDPEVFLHRAVLINNTMKKMQKEIREEKKRLIYGESIENITFPARVPRDCEYERDVLCDSQSTNTTILPFYDGCFDFYDCSHASERLGDDSFPSPIFPGLQLDANKNEPCKSEALTKPSVPDMDNVFNNLISALET